MNGCTDRNGIRILEPPLFIGSIPHIAAVVSAISEEISGISINLDRKDCEKQKSLTLYL